jgi:hypothetical protein
MQLRLRKTSLLFAAIVALLLGANVALSQEDRTPKKRLRSPAVVRGFVGGESHDSYVIRAGRGTTMTVRISWRREGDNRAEFTISDSPNFFSAEQVNFGEEFDGGKSWRGKIPATRNYYIYVVAHPTARYTLSVKVK